MPDCCPRPAPPKFWALPAAEPEAQAHTSEAGKLSSKTVGANLVHYAKEVCANGGKTGMGQGLGRTSASAPRSLTCTAA